MAMNKPVHTGPKTQSGGFHDGFSRAAYQVVSEVLVQAAPTTPVPREAAKNNASINA